MKMWRRRRPLKRHFPPAFGDFASLPILPLHDVLFVRADNLIRLSALLLFLAEALRTELHLLTSSALHVSVHL